MLVITCDRSRRCEPAEILTTRARRGWWGWCSFHGSESVQRQLQDLARRSNACVPECSGRYDSLRMGLLILLGPTNAGCRSFSLE